MEFWGDDRGQSIQVGAILLFGILIIAMATYQTTVVPSQNKQVEFNQNQDVQDDMVNLRSGVIDAADSGNSESTVIKLGAQYPSRSLFINPPPPSGRLQSAGTSDPDINVTVSNADTSVAGGGSAEDVGDFWNGTNRTFTTGAITYTPNYNNYRAAPETVYENTLVHNVQNDATIPRSEQILLDGKELTVFTIDGDLSRSGVASRTVDINPTSSSDNVVQIENETANVTVTVPTRLSESAWRDLLDEEFSDGHLLGIDYQTNGPGEFSLLTLELEQNTTYRLRMAELGVGTGASDPPPAYVVKQRGDNMTVVENTTHTLEVEVRDELGNPVKDGTVNVSIDGSGNLSAPGEDDLNNVSVDEDGLVTLIYDAPSTVNSPETVRVNVSLDNSSSTDTSDPRETQFALDTTGEAGGSTSGGAGTSGKTDHSAEQNQTVSAEGGLWVNITDVNSINLRDPRFSPIEPQGGQVKQSERYFRLALVMNNSSTRYVFVLGDKQGISYKQLSDNRSWQNSKVYLYKYKSGDESGPVKLFEGKEFASFALDSWLDGNSLEPLLPLYYSDPSSVESDLNEVEQFLNESNSNDSVQAFITDMTGRTQMELVNETDDNERNFLKIGNADDNNLDPTAVNVDNSSTDDFAALKFDLVNKLPNKEIDEVRTVNITVEAANGNVTRIENGQGGAGSYNYEFYFSGNSREGYIDAGFDTGTTQTLDSKGDMAGGNTYTVYINEFRTTPGGSPVNLQIGDTITLTVEYVIDGEEYYKELTFEIEDRVDNT